MVFCYPKQRQGFHSVQEGSAPTKKFALLRVSNSGSGPPLGRQVVDVLKDQGKGTVCKLWTHS